MTKYSITIVLQNTNKFVIKKQKIKQSGKISYFTKKIH